MSKRIYTHKHHIIPRHAGGSNDPSNIVVLTTEEHALAHKKLFFIYGRWQDELAYQCLSGQIGNEEAILIAVYKGNKGRKFSEATKKRMAERMKGNTHMLGKKHTEETKRKIGLKSKGRKHTEEQNETKRQRMIGTKHTEETKEKIRQARKKQVHSEETKEKIRQTLLRRYSKV